LPLTWKLPLVSHPLSFSKEWGVSRETDISTEPTGAQAPPRIPVAHGDQERTQGVGASSRQGSQAPERLENPHRLGGTVSLKRLTRRKQFTDAAGGVKSPRRLVVVQGRLRDDQNQQIGIGFTATRKVGSAVIRNRAKRRLREAARALLPKHGVAGCDYVMIARRDTADAIWSQLLDDVSAALLSLADRLARTDIATKP